MRKKNRITVILLILDCILIIGLAGVILLCYSSSGFHRTILNREDLGIVERADYLEKKRTEQETEKSIAKERKSEIETTVSEEQRNIKNIAFFGIDSTDSQAWRGDQYRSDSIIIFSIDSDRNTVKMTNILRDSKVPIEGHDPQKINAAYKYGFAPLAIKTLNQNFKMDIEDYITIDFAGIEALIDILGGVEIELTDEESSIVPGTVPGLNLLNGNQTMLYSRIRKIDSDYYRASRQQKVLGSIFDKIRNIPKKQYPDLIRNFIQCMETSLSYGKAVSIVNSLDVSTLNIETNTIPDYAYEEDLWGGIDETGSWVWIYDLDAATKRLHSFIYDD